MQAAILTGPRRVEFQDVPVPELAPDDVLVQVEGCGVCPSDLPSWRGRPGSSYPLEAGAPGHQAWGRVLSTGGEVLGVSEGDRVVLLSRRGFATHAVDPAASIALLPPELEGLPVPGDAVGCAMNILRRSQIAPGDVVAVVGVGFLGALVVELLRDRGAEILALSRRPCALDEANRRGAHHVVSMVDHGAARRRAMEITGGLGCDRVIEVTGEQRPLDLAAEIARVGARLIIAGQHNDLRMVDMPLWNEKELDVVNAHHGREEQRLLGVHEGIAAILEGRLDPFPLFTRIPLANLVHAFTLMETRPPGFFKALVIP